MVKITIEEEGKEAVVIQSDSYFVWSDTSVHWKGVDTHLSKMLELYSEKIIKQLKEDIVNGRS